MAIYKKKTTEIYTDNKYAIDGCATFFRRDRFSLVKKYEVEFNKAALSLAESFTNPQQKKSALNRLLKVHGAWRGGACMQREGWGQSLVVASTKHVAWMQPQAQHIMRSDSASVYAMQQLV